MAHGGGVILRPKRGVVIAPAVVGAKVNVVVRPDWWQGDVVGVGSNIVALAREQNHSTDFAIEGSERS